MTISDRLRWARCWVKFAWDTALEQINSYPGKLPDRTPSIPAHTAHREHETRVHELADRARRRSHVPTLTSAERERLIRDAEEADTLPPGRLAIRPPPPNGRSN